MSSRPWGMNERDRERDREATRQRQVVVEREKEVEKNERHAASTINHRPTIVQLDGLVLLKIMNHSKESMPEVVSGQLLGLDIGQKLEITNSFPFPTGLSEEASDAYQLEMMKLLRSVNVDNNTVGWYQSAYLGTFFDQGLLDAQYTYQKHIPNSVVVVYDPFQSAKGRLVIAAYRLSDEFMSVYSPAGSAASILEGAKPKFTYEEFNKLGLDSTKIFESIPIKVHNSHLVHGFLYELREEKYTLARTPDEVEREWSSSVDRLSLNYSSFLEKNLHGLGNAIENYSQEQGKFQFFLRAQQRIKQQQTDYLKRRSQENENRVASGKEPLPEEDLSKNPLFRNQPSKPHRLDTHLTANQIQYYCQTIQATAQQTIQKLYLIEAMQKKETEAPAAASSSSSSSSSTKAEQKSSA